MNQSTSCQTLLGKYFSRIFGEIYTGKLKGLVGKDALAELAIGQVEFNNQIGKGPITGLSAAQV